MKCKAMKSEAMKSEDREAIDKSGIFMGDDRHDTPAETADQHK